MARSRLRRRESLLRGARNRLLQLAAQHAPGAQTLRVRLHRLRGVTIGPGSWIGAEALIETSRPELVWVGAGVQIGIRVTIVAHFRGAARGDGPAVRLEDQCFVGPGAIVMPNVTVGRGAVVSAGSVVTRSVPPLTMVQGNPAVPVARLGVPLGLHTPMPEFLRELKPIARS